MLRKPAVDDVDQLESMPPVTYTGDPSASDWLKLDWSDWLALKAMGSFPAEAGIYRLSITGSVVYLGESENLSERLKSHAGRFDSRDVFISYVLMPQATKIELHERETDLIGAFYKAVGKPPQFQYGNQRG